jgi:hypothetical protein
METERTPGGVMFPDAPAPSAADAGPEFPGAAPEGGGGMRESLGVFQGIARTLETAVGALQAMHRAGSAPTPGVQDIGSPALVWDAGVEGFPAASPSVNSSSLAGVRGAGGYGAGSDPGDRTNFLEPGKRRPSW